MMFRKGQKVVLKGEMGDVPVGTEFIVKKYGKKDGHFFGSVKSTEKLGKYTCDVVDGVIQCKPDANGTPRTVGYFDECETLEELDANFSGLFEGAG